MDSIIRSKLRIENLSRAYHLFAELRYSDISSLSQLEKEGIIHRLRFTFELAWKALIDKMETDGLVLNMISPKAVLREAYKAKYIDHIDSWLKMIGDRNLMNHTYDFATFELIIPTIIAEYIDILEALYLGLIENQL
ncbi:MAG: HI0074 family nucleotidyltransferase substrate-binding subunit [Saprospiraceae bacterium]